MNQPSPTVRDLAAYIRRAQQLEIENESIWADPSRTEGMNNYLFFIKPEITKASSILRLEEILELILGQIDRFGFRIHSVRILSAGYLERYNLIDAHYGIISEVSNLGKSALNTAARERFREIYDLSPDEVEVLGGMEILKRYSFFNAHSLDCLWQNQENLRLGSGAYVEKIRIDLETLYLLNGFHPRQLQHFTEPGRSIVLFHLSGDRPWKEARDCFAGATNPVKAEAGSLRRLLLERKDEFGVPEIAQSFNGIHLSAGPVEALVEMHRFGIDPSPVGFGSLPSKGGKIHEWMCYSFGKQLFEKFGEKAFSIVENVRVVQDGKKISVFDLTENLDSEEALSALERFFT